MRALSTASAFALGASTIPHSRSLALTLLVAFFSSSPWVAAHAAPEPERASSALTLEQLLAFAEEHAPSLHLAKSSRVKAEAELEAASLLLRSNPELSLGVGPRRGSDGIGTDVEVGLSQELEIAGERGKRIDAAGHLLALADARIEEARWALHCDLHAAFHEALIEESKLRLARQLLEFQEGILDVVQRQIAAGEVAPLVLRLAQAEVARARQGVVTARGAFGSSRLRLARLSGWPMEDPPLPLGPPIAPKEPPPLEELLALAWERLPTLRAAEAEVAEALARIDVADREGWPNPSVGVQYVREGNPSRTERYDIWLGVLSVPIPGFQRNQGERARARADARVAKAELAVFRDLLAGRIEEARGNVSTSAQRLAAYGDEILPRFEENLHLLSRAYELGEIDLLALSSGKESFLGAQTEAIAAQADYFQALSELERTIGVDLWIPLAGGGSSP